MRIAWSQRAADRVAEISLWIYERDPTASERFLAKLNAVVGRLADNPELGQPVPDWPRFRRLPVDEFIVVYRIVGDEVRIRTVYHGRYQPPLDDITEL